MFAIVTMPMSGQIDSNMQVGSVELNTEQRRAVALVLTAAAGRTPVAIFGPPGTGKTVTLVEAALQVRRQQSLQAHGAVTSHALHSD